MFSYNAGTEGGLRRGRAAEAFSGRPCFVDTPGASRPRYSGWFKRRGLGLISRLRDGGFDVLAHARSCVMSSRLCGPVRAVVSARAASVWDRKGSSRAGGFTRCHGRYSNLACSTPSHCQPSGAGLVACRPSGHVRFGCASVRERPPTRVGVKRVARERSPLAIEDTACRKGRRAHLLSTSVTPFMPSSTRRVVGQE